ncbi:MAG: extensin family protein [Hyphomicrobiaceae bacterium]|nr:extensin family protein [Hyphomicrobiaceae bacterium]
MASQLLVSCGTSGPSLSARQQQMAPIVAAEERRCLSSGAVVETAFIRQRSALGGPEVCGALSPFEMSAADQGRIAMKPAALLRCPMIGPVDDWLARTVSPAAVYYLGEPVIEIRVAASYSCRTRNGLSGTNLSEHGLANALDVSGFRLADGRVVTVKQGWHGDPAEAAFLRAVHEAACRRFTTVLGPDADRFHHDHFHVDLARHDADGRRRVCK